MDLAAQISRNIASRKLFPDEGSGLVAVSGGVDSMVLLDLLAKLAKKHHWVLVVAHLNHRLRGAESEGDQRLVETTAKRLGLKFVTENCDVRQVARRRKISIEMAARECRHEFLARTSRSLGITTVALAHHADDQVELFFLRLFRGGSVTSLGGMNWRSPSPADPEIFLVRPMLNLKKSVLQDFAGKEGVDYREDQSNQSLVIPRNRIREQLLPLLRKNYQPGLDEVVARAMEILRDEDECMKILSERELGKFRKKEREKASPNFAGLPIAMQRRWLLAQLDRLEIKPEFEMIEFLRLHPDKTLSIESASSEHRGNRLIKLESNGLIRFVRIRAGEFQPLAETLSLKKE